jgi:hypothetical protein
MEAAIIKKLALGLLISSIVFVFGCRPPTQNSLELQPSVLDLGKIASTGQQVETKFTVRNNSMDKVRARIVTACSCLLAGMDELVLHPGETKELSLMVSTHGRSGEFTTELAVSTVSISYRLPIKALFEPQVFSFPSRLVFYPSEDSSDQLNGHVTIEAPMDLWQELELMAEEDYQIQSDDDGVKRRFLITCSANESKNYPPLILRRKNQDTPVLSIPAISGVQ